jgi:uncharacterized damage-inducible protein DinB
MDGNELVKLYEFGLGATKLNLRDITQEDSLRPSPGGANPLNWVVGHMVASRGLALRLLQAEPVWDAETAAMYSGQEDAVFEPGCALPLEQLVAAVEASLARGGGARRAPTPEMLAAPSRRGTVADTLVFLHFHEGYHAGQLGLLRRFLGKAGVIKPPKTAR